MVYQTKRICTLAVVTAFICFLAMPRLLGQNTNAGEIRGTVSDPSGAVIPGAVVTIRNVNTNITLTLITNSAGIYQARSVQPGDYVLAFAKEGFEKLVHSPITLRLGIITVDAQLQVGSTAQQVSVEALTPLLQTESAEHSATVTSKEITELPNVGVSWWSLATLIPGNVGSGDDIRANGQRGYSGSFLVDGGSATFVNTQSSGEMKVPDEAISEVKFSTGNFSAENGNGLAIFNVITKGGTNQFHGSAFEYVQNEFFNSSDYFTNRAGQEKPLVRWNLFGGSVGGPIKRDKAFFFFSFQRLLNYSHASGFYNFPDASIRQGDFSELLTQSTPTVIYDPYSLHQVDGQWVRTPLPGNRMSPSQLDPIAQKIASYMPEPNLPGLISNYYWSGRSPNNRYWLSGRGDYNVSSNNRLNGSVLVGQQQISWVDPRPQNQSEFSMQATQAQVSDVWTLSPSLVNELRLTGFIWPQHGTTPSIGKGYPQELGLINTIYDIFPTINIWGIGGSGIGGGVSTRNKQGSFSPSDVLSWNKGRHLLKFGFEHNWSFTNSSSWGDMSAGNFTFSGLFSSTPTGSPENNVNGMGFADFLFGLPNSWGIGPISPYTGSRIRNTQAFAQDDFKVRPNLTLNLGVRWLYQGGWTEVHNRLASFDPTLVNPATGTLGALWYAGQNGRRALQDSVPAFFAPRAGFAWSPKPSWVVRGGYGIYTVPWNSGNYQWPGGGAYGWALQGWLGSTDQLTPPFTLGPTPAGASAAYPGLAQGPAADAIHIPTAADRPASLLNGQNISYSPRHTPVGYMQEVEFSIQHQIANTVFKGTYIFTHGTNLTFYRDMNQVPADKLGPGDAQLQRSYPQYQAINTPFSDGVSNYNALQVTVQRYFSRGLSFLFNYTLSKSLDNGTASGWGVGQDSWQIAADPNANYGLSSNDETHLVSGSFVYELPFGAGKRFLGKRGLVNGIVGGWQLSSMFRFNSGYPFTPFWGGLNQSGALAGTLYPDRVGKGTVSNPGIDRWFDTSPFVQPAPYTFGNSGRNILRAPGLSNVDFALAKSFAIPKLGEAARLQVRIDATNAFNITNLGAPSQWVGSYGAGMIWYCGPMRQAQIGAKLSF